MNRPFYAIGVLLAFLAVAMLAVGLSSRPTRQPASAQSGSGIVKPRRGPGSAVFLLAVPDEVAEESAVATTDAGEGDEEEDFAGAGESAEQPSYEDGCGLDRSTGQVYAPLNSAVKISLNSAVVTLAADLPMAEECDLLDCRSHYDAQYDATIYGGEASRNGLKAPPLAHDQSDDQTIMLFRSLIGERFDRRAGQGPRTRAANRNWRFELQAMRSGVVNQLWRSSERLGLADEWVRMGRLLEMAPDREIEFSGPAWSDYEDWCDSPQAGVADRDTPVGGTAAFLNQPWRQVLQFAVSWLNHAAKTLGAAAERLSGWQSEPAGDSIGLRSTDYQPR